MSRICLGYSPGINIGGSRLKIAILGANLKSLCEAHSILDHDSNALITIYTEDAEVGFSEAPSEPISLNKILKSISPDWYGSIPNSVDHINTSSTSSSWLVKALGIRLAERGGIFLLHTTISDINEKNQEISFRGGGQIPSGIQRYDQLLDFRPQD